MKITRALTFAAAVFIVTAASKTASAAGYDNECLANFNKTCCDKIFARYPAGSLPREERMSKLAACVAGGNKALGAKPSKAD